MVGRDGLQLDLDLALHGAADRELLLVVGFQEDLLLDEVFVLIAGDPGGAGSERWGLIGTVVDDVALVGEEHLEVLVGGLGRLALVGHLVEVVVDNLAQVDEHVLLDAHLRVLVDLDSGGVHDAQVTDEVLAVLADDHELGLPELLVVGDLVVVGVTLANLEHAGVTVERDVQALDLFGVDGLELQVQLVGGSLVGDALVGASLHVGAAGVALVELNVLQLRILGEARKLRVGLRAETGGNLLNLASALRVTRVGLDLGEDHVKLGGGVGNAVSDLLSVGANGENVVVLGGILLVGGNVLLVVLAALAVLPEFAEGLEEVVGADGGLALEVGEPKDTRVEGGQLLADLVVDVVVDDVLEVDLVEVVGPRVQHREALVLDVLGAVLLDVLLDEVELGFVRADRVREVVLVDDLAGVAHERVDRLDARGGLQVLVLDLRVQARHERLVAVGAHRLQDAHEHLLEALHVPVLVDGGVDHVRSEDLLGLVRQQEHQVVHGVHGLHRAQVQREVVGQQLLEQEAEGVGHGGSEGLVLAGEGGGHLDLVGEGSGDGHREHLG